MSGAIPINAFMDAVLGDEGWQSSLEGEAIETVIARLEAHYPPDAVLEPAEAARVRAGLRTLAAWAEARRIGTLGEAELVAGTLALLGL